MVSKLNTLTENIDDVNAEDLLGGMFGRHMQGLPVKILKKDFVFKMTRRLIGIATHSINCISITGAFMQEIPESIWKNDDITKKILLYDCKRESVGLKKKSVSKPVIPDNLDIDEKLLRYEKWHRILEANRDSVEIRMYSTTPWIRGTFVDGRYGVFLMPLHLTGGKESITFYSYDHRVIENLTQVFDNVWDDSRTTDFSKYYKTLQRQSG